MSVNLKGYLDWTNRTLIEIVGPDSKSFLHRFCTNDIDRLGPGDGCEAFITSVQGKTLGHVLVSVVGESVVLETVPGQSSLLMPHLDRYLFNEKAQLIDRSTEWSQTLLVGSAWAERFSECSTATGAITAIEFAGTRVSVVTAPRLTQPSWLLRYSASDSTSVLAELLQSSKLIKTEAFELVRIRSGFPYYGQDFDDKNLPQELNRNDHAISFTKGCYLGQETIARLDALGHVNKLLKGLRFEGGGLSTGEEVSCEGKPIGTLTSCAEDGEVTFALAIVRQSAATAGTPVQANGVVGVVCDLPM